MNAFSRWPLLLCLLALSACSSAPRRATLVPSARHVTAKVDAAKNKLAQAQAAVVQVKLSLAQNRPDEASAGLDTLTSHLLTADTELAAAQDAIAAYDTKVEAIARLANANADDAAVWKDKAEQADRARDRWRLLAGALLAWICRKQLARFLGLALNLCGIPVPTFLIR